MDRPPEKEEKPSLRARLPNGFRLAYAYCTIAAALYLLLGIIVPEWDGLWRREERPLAIIFIFLFGCITAMGAGLLLRQAWGRWLAVASSIILLPLFGWMIAIDAAYVAAMLVVPIIAALMMLTPAMRTEFTREPHGSRREETWRSTRPALLLGVGLLLISVVTSEARSVGQDIRVWRWNSQCEETGGVEPCGRSALSKIQRATSVADLADGERELRAMCEEGAGGVCRVWAMTRTVSYDGVMWEGADLFYEERRKRSSRTCLQGDMRGCWVRAMVNRTITDEAERAEVLASAEEGCEAGETFGCWAAWKIRAGTTDADKLNARQRDAATAACDERLYRACAQVGRGNRIQTREACWRGDVGACAALTDETDGIELDVYRAMADVPGSERNLAFLGAIPQTGGDELRDECDLGSAVACFGAGLWLVRDEAKSWRPKLPDREALDATFGAACELGMDVACRAYALRLIDREIGAERDLETANALLTTACERGDGLACWYRPHHHEIIDHQFDGLRESALKACRRARSPKIWHVDPCNTHANLLAAEIDASPWPMDERVGLAFLRNVCATAEDRTTCSRLAWMYRLNVKEERMPWAHVPPMRTSAYDAGAMACARGFWWGCQGLPDTAKAFKWAAPDSHEELQDRVCSQMQSMCDEGLFDGED